MNRLIKISLLFTAVSFSSFAVYAQNGSVRTGGQAQSSGFKTPPAGSVNNNYNTVSNTSSSTVSGTTTIPLEIRTNQVGTSNSKQISSEGTGEYLLVPAIVRKDPQGTAVRMNTSGASIIALLDRGFFGGLTDVKIQPFSTDIILGVAESRFRKAIEFQPDNYVYHANLASVLFRQRKNKDALAAIRRAIELNPNNQILKNYEETISGVKVTVIVLDDDQVENK